MIKRDFNQSYLVSPPVMSPRVTDETLQTHISLKWEYVPQAVRLHGNLSLYLQYNLEKKAFEWVENPQFRLDTTFVFEVMSAALVVYRLMCLFLEPPRISKDAYKTLWEYPLKHVATGNTFILLDYKASLSLSTKFSHCSEMPPDFAKDVLELLNFLVSNQVTHPYDGVLAGTVA
ncbi:MAG: hypothetical protein RLZZ628_3068 [Bacteroidota bacterium]|jgi:hypothetical protein